MMDFNGKTVVVSGAAIGFGNAIAERFRAAGATVFGCDIADADRPFSDGVLLEKVDLLDRRAGAAWIASIEQRTGRGIDILVCNAGGVAGQANRPLEDVTDQDWDRVVDINLGSAFTLCRAAAPAMKQQGSGASSPSPLVQLSRHLSPACKPIAPQSTPCLALRGNWPMSSGHSASA